MLEIIPPFDWSIAVVEPWTLFFETTLWTVVMGFLVTLGCGLIGNYLLLRRMALVGDAISHSILPGLVVSFLIFHSTSVWVAFLGAFFAGLLTVVLIEVIHKQSRVKVDTAIVITFTTLFALGVVMVNWLEAGGTFHLDADCILYGELEFIATEQPVVLGGISLAPPQVVRMLALALAASIAIVVFYKELLVTSFDPGLSKSLGMNVDLWHYSLMGALSLMVVGVFEAVGAILAVAMLIVPPMFAAQLSDRLPTRFALTALHAALSSILGFHLGRWLNCPTASAMVVAGSGLFCLAWGGTLALAWWRRRNANHIADQPTDPTLSSRSTVHS